MALRRLPNGNLAVFNTCAFDPTVGVLQAGQLCPAHASTTCVDRFYAASRIAEHTGRELRRLRSYVHGTPAPRHPGGATAVSPPFRDLEELDLVEYAHPEVTSTATEPYRWFTYGSLAAFVTCAVLVRVPNPLQYVFALSAFIAFVAFTEMLRVTLVDTLRRRRRS